MPGSASALTGREPTTTTRDWLKFKNPEAPAVRRESGVPAIVVADRAAPWVFIFSPGNTEGGCDHADHTERATNGCYAEEGDEAEQG